MFKFTAIATAVALSSTLISTVAISQDDSIVEEMVTVGSRAKPRSTTESPAPVDVISASDFINQGGVDTSNLLRNVVPSFNVNDQPISDGATMVRPANLRGMAPDHTLVLVNGQRRHRGAVITWLGNGISDGSQGPDIAAIPSSALKSVEVLRDGAAAQYGSDAIAGVINFNLKDADSGGSVEFKTGQYSEGDGSQVSIAVNKGFALGDDGFLNVTAEWSEADATDRSVQRDDAQTLIDNGYKNVGVPAQVWGVPEVSGDIKLWVNFAKEIANGVELYGYANHNTKDILGGFYYRNPTNRAAVYSNDEGKTLLIGDLTPGAVGTDNSEFGLLSTGDGIDCPVVGLTDGKGGANGSGVIVDPVTFAEVAADPNCFSFQETITGGFTPNFGGTVEDTAFNIGFRGENEDGFIWSVSTYYGSHLADFLINRTVNASLGPNSPRDFNPGAYTQTDTGVNADFSYAVSDKLNFAFGTEWRSEEFTITPGQTESYIDGGLGAQGFSTSTNGFPGFSPRISGSWDRSNTAAYVDIEYDATDSFLVTAALRSENYEDFGTTTNYKIGTNLSITDSAGIRSTISTGFKAPTPGQNHASNITTQFVSGVLTNKGIVPPGTLAARQVGAQPLTPELSSSFTLGGYFSTGNVDVTVDFFNITVEDRLSLSNDFNLDDNQVEALKKAGISPSDFSSFSFFSNQFDTSTRGLDVVATTNTEWLSGVTTWNLAFNYTDTTVTKNEGKTLVGTTGESNSLPPLDTNRVNQIQDGTPATRWNMSAVHNTDHFRYLVRLSYYGSYYDGDISAVFSSNVLLDLEASYRPMENLDFSIGARNVTDETGCTTVSCGGETAGNYSGLGSSQYTPFGFNGGYYYGRVTYTF